MENRVLHFWVGEPIMLNSDKPTVDSHIELQNRVRERAHEIWQARGHHNGEDTSLEDWLQAEREVLGATSDEDALDRGTVVGSAFAGTQASGRKGIERKG